MAQESKLEDEDEIGEGPSSGRKNRRKRRMTAFEVSQIIVEGNSHSLTELQALALKQKGEGKTDLAKFLINRNPRALADVMQSTWEIEESKARLERGKKTRMELMQEARMAECAPGCDGNWYDCAKKILDRSGLTVEYFSEVVRELLIKGRGKYRNLMLTGPANCGKHFFSTLLHLFSTSFVIQRRALLHGLERKQLSAFSLTIFVGLRNCCHGMTCFCCLKVMWFTYPHLKHTSQRT